MQGIVRGGLNNGGSNVKSVQQGRSSMPSTTTRNITISAVDITKSVPRVYAESGSNANDCLLLAELTSATNLRVTCFANSSVTFQWEVVEYKNVKSFQNGTATTTSGTTDITVSAVDMTKTILFFTCKADNNSLNISAILLAGYLTSVTNIRFARDSVNKVINWYLVEFN